MRYICLLLLSGLLLNPDPASAQIEKSVSEVTGVERLESTEMRNILVHKYPGSARYQAEYERHPKEGQTWRLSFYGFSKDTTQMSHATDVLLKVDGKSVTPTLVESKTRQLDNSVLEIKHAEFSLPIFRKIATAKTVTISIGPARFELNHSLRKDVRLILKRVSPGAGAPTASTDSSNEE